MLGLESVCRSWDHHGYVSCGSLSTRSVTNSLPGAYPACVRTSIDGGGESERRFVWLGLGCGRTGWGGTSSCVLEAGKQVHKYINI